MRITIVLAILIFCISVAKGEHADIVVVDSLTHSPLPNASIFDRVGKCISTTGIHGNSLQISSSSYPITIRYLGFYEKTVPVAGADTIFLQECMTQLPEVVVKSKRSTMLHILAYVREYSTLSTYTDTITMFREKMVDFMLPTGDKSRYKGWHTPRVLKSRSYYHFTNAIGLDSVSDRCNHHFTWSDWMGFPPTIVFPSPIMESETASDTLRGKYGSYEIWTKDRDRIKVDINVMDDAPCLKWVPDLHQFFVNENIDFGKLQLRLTYNNCGDNLTNPSDLTAYSFHIESRGRGHDMFRFNRIDQPLFVATYTEVYIADKEYLSIKSAKKCDKSRSATEICKPIGAPPLPPAILTLIDRVNNVDTDTVRLNMPPDKRLKSRHVHNNNYSIGKRALFILKQVTGIGSLNSNRNLDHNWRKFKEDQMKDK